MPLIRPFRALRPHPQFAADVAAPPYDVLSSEEAKIRAQNRPHSFLHISKAEIDLPPEMDHYAPEVYVKSAENLQKLMRENILMREAKACYYAYRLIMGEGETAHTQIGLIVAASVNAYDENRIRKHEFTRVDKEDDRVRQIEALNAQTGPVLLAHKDNLAIEEILLEAIKGEPIADLTADTGVKHSVWRMDNEAIIAKISKEINSMETLYIADGHHRSAAASRVAAARRDPAQNTNENSAEFFLAVAFSAKQMRILDYNRVARDLNGLSAEELIEKLQKVGVLTQKSAPVAPKKVGVCGVYLNKTWYELAFHEALFPPNDPVKSLDVSVLSDHVLEPILGIADLRRDTRIDFVGGIRGLKELEKRVDSGQMALAFSMFATPMQALMNVADAGQIMPPKSTWFEPKLADGLASHVLD